jgi:hypothetical protein
LDFGTTAPAEGGGCSPGNGPAPASQTGSATISITRPGIDELKRVVTNMVANGFGVAGSIVSPVVQTLLGPILDQALSALGGLTEVKGTGYVTVTAPGPGGGRCTTTTSATSTTLPPSKSLSCPADGWLQAELGLTYALAPGIAVQTPTFAGCTYAATDEDTIDCPQGDGSIANGSGGDCQVVEVNEYADVPAQGLNANEFCELRGPCSGQVRLPPSAVGGAFAVEAIDPKGDPPAIWIVSDKDNLEIDVGVGWEANLGLMEALLRQLYVQHLGA